MSTTRTAPSPPLRDIVREWGRIGCIGFGGPPAHVTLLRDLCVTRRGWLSDDQFERALAAVNLLPGPASTQLAIYCAWRLRGNRGALLGGLSFILPGLVAILALSALFLAGSPPKWVRGAGMGAGAAVPAVAVCASLGVARPIFARARGRLRVRVILYALVGGAAAATVGPQLVLVLLACGAVEFAWRGAARWELGAHIWPLLATATGGTVALAWTAFKVGALCVRRRFVIVPLMQADAVNTYHWMTHSQFLNAVALRQVTPGPVTQTVAAVGYSPGGLAGGAFRRAPRLRSFVLVHPHRSGTLRAPALERAGTLVSHRSSTCGGRRHHRLGRATHSRNRRDMAVPRARRRRNLPVCVEARRRGDTAGGGWYRRTGGVARGAGSRLTLHTSFTR